jgi:hypothetical protein
MSSIAKLKISCCGFRFPETRQALKSETGVDRGFDRFYTDGEHHLVENLVLPQANTVVTPHRE